MLTDPVVDVRGIYKSFKTVQAVNGIDLQIAKGQFTAILGPNGAGKTTLVEMIEGIQKPDKGEILIMGKTWKGNEDELHQLIGLSLQETRFIDKLTVRETLTLFASFFRLPKTRVDEIIDLTGLGEKVKSYVVNLSGGQRQRLALGIALLNEPKILLLDEPTTGLDPNARQEVWAILRQLKQKSGTSLILTTHYMEEAEQLCDFIIIMDNGIILQQGTLSQLLEEDSTQGKIIEFSLEKAALSFKKLMDDSPYKVQWEDGKDKGILTVRQIETELPEFLSFLQKSNLHLKTIHSRKKTLDDLFITLTGRHLHE
jgi:ABC-2 type transport system ATP-binding protein